MRRRPQEGVAEDLGRRAVQDGVARVGTGIDRPGEADRRECSGAVDQNDALAPESADLAREERGDPGPGGGIREVRREVLESRRPAPADVDDARAVARNRPREGQADPARRAGDEGQGPRQGRIDTGSERRPRSSAVGL